MKQVIVQNLSRPIDRPVQAHYCASFLCQLRGLTFRKNLPFDQGLLLVQGHDSRLEAAIHMLFVWIDLAVVWINEAHEVVDVKLARRWRLAYVPQQPARFVLEIVPDRMDDFRVGDRVRIEDQ